MNEAILRSEIERLRSTYSFRLGLMITDAFFRKPWQIPILPFRFLKLNFDFMRKKGNSSNKSFNSYERDENSLMLFVASEGGKAACDRAMQMGKNWLKKTGHHIVIVSSNTGMIGFDEPNMSLYMLPDPKSKRVVSKKDWNFSCENVLYRAIHSHAPSSFIFDGPYPYRGVLNAIKSVVEMKTIWITSERTEESVIQRCSQYFSDTFQRNYSTNAYVSRNSRSRNYHSLTNKILIATNYGSHNLTERIPSYVNHALSKYNKLDLICIEQNSRNNNDDAEFTEVWKDFDSTKNLESLQGAIVSDNLDLITQLHRNMVPTICILHEKTNSNIKGEIYRMALSGGLFVTTWKDKDELELYVDAIVNREWNLAITQNETPNVHDALDGLLN